MCCSIFVMKYIVRGTTTIQDDNPFAFHRTLIWGLPCALFLLGATFFEQSFNKKIPRMIILAGDASYSGYLIHMKVFPIIAQIFRYLSLGSILYLITIVPMCLIVSIAFYIIVEKPLITGIVKRLHYKKPVIMN
jgi:exopolysaccharide production protein ExoZ